MRWLFCLRWPLPLEERAPAPAEEKAEQGRVLHPPPGSAFSSARAGVALPLFWCHSVILQTNKKMVVAPLVFFAAGGGAAVEVPVLESEGILDVAFEFTHV